MESQSVFNFKQNFNLRPSETDEAFKLRHSIFLVLVYLANAIIISTIVTLVFEGIFSIVKVDSSISTAITQTVTTVISLALTIPFVYKALYKDAQKSSKRFLLVLLMSIGFFVLYYAIIILYTKFIETNIIKGLVKINIISQETYALKTDSLNQQAIEQMFSNNISTAIAVPAIAVFGPIFEEIIFRKAFFRLFNFKKKSLNIILTSVLFGLIHVSSSIMLILSQIMMGKLTGNGNIGFDAVLLECIYFFNYFLAGAILGTVYSITGNNIVPSIIVHILNNSLVSILLILS